MDISFSEGRHRIVQFTVQSREKMVPLMTVQSTIQT